MRLDVQVRKFLGESLGRRHLLRRRSDGEARGDGDVVSALAVPVGNHLPRFVIAHLRRVEQALRGIAVHHHLAADHAHVAAHGLREVGVGGGLMDGAIGGSRRCAVAGQFIVEMRRDLFGMRGFDEAAFFREGVGVQPFEQVGCVGGDHLHLRKVQMRVDEARHNEVWAVVDLDRICRSLLPDVGIGADRRDLACLDQQAAVALVAVAVRISDAEGRALEREQAPAQDVFVIIAVCLRLRFRTRRRAVSARPT